VPSAHGFKQPYLLCDLEPHTGVMGDNSTTLSLVRINRALCRIQKCASHFWWTCGCWL